MKIYVTAPFDEKLIQELKGTHQVIYEPWSEDKELLSEEELKLKLIHNDTEIYICESEIVSARVLEGIKNLKMICVCRAGVNDIDLSTATKHGIYVTNTPGRNANAVAEMTVALLVMVSRYMNVGERALREGKWDDGLYFRMRGIELYGRTIGFVGFGAVARELAKKLAGFEMKKIAYDPYVSQEVADEYGVVMVDADTLFNKCDYVSNHLPVTTETKGFINATRLAQMKSSAYLINTARSATVDENAVVEALRNHTITGAAFDVYSQEPLPTTHPLLSLDNVVLMPHLGGASTDVVSNHSRLVLEDIALFTAGKPPKHIVNRDLVSTRL
jgi:phosphoglycerate dehydrogenase-like enzyme